jgi:pimeloyl-ACP methyl ester carboxylesterase
VDLVREVGRGRLTPGTRLTGTPPPVSVQLVAAGTAAAPTGMKDAIERIPYGSQGQVVVEKYTMPDGRSRFVTYIDGTREMKRGTDEPWDMDSNLDMYLEHRTAASQQATLKALEAAGAKPGDRVDFVGYSQGAAIGSFTAMDSPYVTEVVIAAGNPVSPHLDSDQLYALLEHDGDIVGNLADGPPGGTGSAGSFTVSRDIDRLQFTDEHAFREYEKTAGMADASGDSRVEAMDRLFFDELGEAVSVERMEFHATRE